MRQGAAFGSVHLWSYALLYYAIYIRESIQDSFDSVAG